MKYQGGKTRIARRIAPVIRAMSEGRTNYIEPFLGSAAVFTQVIDQFEGAIGSDAQVDLMMMWQEAVNGWRAPTSLSEQEYQELRSDSTPSALRAFAAYPCSYAGKRWGGYARDPNGDRSFAREGSNSLERRAAVMRRHPGLRLVACEYELMSPLVDSDTVVYCDPPYRNTLSYKDSDKFDHDRFWQVMDDWSDRAAVLVSEYQAPDHWQCVLEIDRHVSTSLHNSAGRAVDRLFVRKDASVQDVLDAVEGRNASESR